LFCIYLLFDSYEVQLCRVHDPCDVVFRALSERTGLFDRLLVLKHMHRYDLHHQLFHTIQRNVFILASSAPRVVDVDVRVSNRWSDVSEIRLRLPMTMCGQSVITPTICTNSNTEVAHHSSVVTPSSVTLQDTICTCQTRCRFPKRVFDPCHVYQLPATLFKFCTRI
jgi:hypothetical protein